MHTIHLLATRLRNDRNNDRRTIVIVHSTVVTILLIPSDLIENSTASVVVGASKESRTGTMSRILRTGNFDVFAMMKVTK